MTGRWTRAALLAVIAVGLVLAGGGLAVALGIGRTDLPAGDSVDAGFARDMSTHHLQAVEMANLALERSDDAEVRQLAFDISSTQTNQAGRMQGWLSLWGLPRTGDAVMAWMGASMDHSMHDAVTAPACCSRPRGSGWWVRRSGRRCSPRRGCRHRRPAGRR